MQNGPSDNPTALVEDELIEAGTAEGNDPASTQSPDEPKQPPVSSGSDSTETSDDELEENEAETEPEKKNPVNQDVDSSNVDILSVMSGAHSRAYHSTYHFGASESKQTLDVFVRVVNLESPARVYKSLEESNLTGYSGCLRTERILLLSCQDENIALSVAKSIAYE